MSQTQREAEGYMSERPSARPNGIPRSGEVVGFAPFRGPRVCVSAAGRIRGAHVLDRDGLSCIFCEFPRPPHAETEDDALPDGGPQVTAPARNRQHAIVPQGPGLILPTAPTPGQAQDSRLPSAARLPGALAEVRRRRGKELIFSRRCRSEQRTRP